MLTSYKIHAEGTIQGLGKIGANYHVEALSLDDAATILKRKLCGEGWQSVTARLVNEVAA